MRYSQFKLALPAAKRKSDPLWARVVLRPLSLPVAWVLMRVGVSGNAVSVAGVVLAICAFFLLASASQYVALFGAFLFFVVSLGDCVDGNIARAKGETGPMGDFMDALGGYTVYALLPLGLGFRAESIFTQEQFSGVFILLGAVIAVSNLYMRLVHQKYVNMMIAGEVRSNTDGTSAKDSLAKRVSSELGLIGWMMPLLVLAVLFSYEWVYLVVYAFFYVAACLVMTAKTARLAYSSG